MKLYVQVKRSHSALYISEKTSPWWQWWRRRSSSYHRCSCWEHEECAGTSLGWQATEKQHTHTPSGSHERQNQRCHRSLLDTSLKCWSNAGGNTSLTQRHLRSVLHLRLRVGTACCCSGELMRLCCLQVTFNLGTLKITVKFMYNAAKCAPAASMTIWQWFEPLFKPSSMFNLTNYWISHRPHLNKLNKRHNSWLL